MNICLLNSHPKYLMGGAELFMFYCAREFVRAGHNVTMVSVYPRGIATRPLPGSEELTDGIRVIHVPDMATDIRSMRKYLAILSEINTDIFLKMFTDPSTILLSWVARRRTLPYVLFMAHEVHCQKDAGLSFAGRYAVSTLTRIAMVTLGLYRWALKGAAHILVQNDRQREMLQANFHLSAADVIPIGHPVPQDLPPKARPPIAIWNARFQPWKHAELFLELAQRLPQHRFVLSGPTAEDRGTPYYQEIEARVRTLSNVEIFPFPQEFETFMTFPLFGQASLFIDTIEHGGFENTLIQAWLRGVPVISHFRSFDGLLEREGIGVSCNGAMDQLVQTVDELLSNTSAREAMGARARAYAMREYDVVPIAARVLSHLTSVVRPRP